MPFQIIRNDITKVKADAIVNSANPKPIFADGTDAAIYKAAGEDLLLAERRKIGNIARGDAAVTPAFSLSAKYIIHTVGPVWVDGNQGEFDILKNCYRNSLEKAHELKCESIAFPLISTGVYGFPKDKALKIAMNEISDFLFRDDVDMQVNLVVFDDGSFRLSKNLFYEIASYIDDESVVEAYKKEYELSDEEYMDEVSRSKRHSERIILQRNGGRYGNIRHFDSEHFFQKPEKEFDPSLFMHEKSDDFSFRDALFRYLNEKNIDNNDAYKRSNIDRRAFAKILSGETKVPKKSTVFAFCIGLDLSIPESEELLASAGMAFTPSNNWDRLVMHFIETGNKDFGDINSAMIACKHPQLGLSFDD
ncbi:MAG: macro domain-containing protein [Lachnospiraceae bacterium]|nr:macro domain-containing protein [Lachnospiraceae bacterium]